MTHPVVDRTLIFRIRQGMQPRLALVESSMCGVSNQWALLESITR